MQGTVHRRLFPKCSVALVILVEPFLPVFVCHRTPYVPFLTAASVERPLRIGYFVFAQLCLFLTITLFSKLFDP